MRIDAFSLRALAPTLALLASAACGSSAPEPATADAAGGDPASMAEPGAADADPAAPKGAGEAAEGPAAGSGEADAPGADAAPAKTEEPVDQDIAGQLSQSDIQKLVEKNIQHFEPCYALVEGGEKKKYDVTVTVKATLGPTGKVNVTEITKSTSKDKKVDECVAGAFKKIAFPRPEGGATSVIHFPMRLEGELK